MSSSEKPKWWPISWTSTWVTISPSVSRRARPSSRGWGGDRARPGWATGRSCGIGAVLGQADAGNRPRRSNGLSMSRSSRRRRLREIRRPRRSTSDAMRRGTARAGSRAPLTGQSSSKSSSEGARSGPQPIVGVLSPSAAQRPLADIDEVAGDGRGRGHGRARPDACGP